MADEFEDALYEIDQLRGGHFVVNPDAPDYFDQDAWDALDPDLEDQWDWDGDTYVPHEDDDLFYIDPYGDTP